LITIADTGVGMSAAVQQKLFKPFFTTKGQTGTGLGLWISEQIVSRHNGALLMRSSQTKHHHGTVFTLFLPFAAVVR
jgi:signal transduction histidine kinase